MIKSNLGIVSRAFALLASKDKQKLVFIALFQVGIGALDTVAVLLIGIIGALSVAGIQSKEPGDNLSAFLERFNLENFSFQTQVSLIALVASALMLSKTLISMYFTRRTLSFLAIRAAHFTSTLARKVLSQDYSVIKSASKQNIMFNLTGGANSLIVGVLGSVVMIISDLMLIIIMLIGLFLVEPIVALTSLVFFSCVAFLLQKQLGSKAEKLGASGFTLSINASESILNTLGNFREIFLRNTLDAHVKNIESYRLKFADISSKMAFLPYVSKYVIESTIILGTLLLAAQLFFLKNADQAVGTLAIILAATSRIAPSILRLQQNFLSIRSSAGSALPALEIFDTIKSNIPDSTNLNQKVSVSEHYDFIPTVFCDKIVFSYSDSEIKNIDCISLNIESGKLVSLVGKSGAGKSTLVDIILGVIAPQEGEILISGVSPAVAVQKWPGAIAYVPQDVVIIGNTILQNITLAANLKDEIDEGNVWDALELAQLKEFIENLPLGLQTIVGDNGAKLSGGQKQRLGIARALYTKPKLIVMDEATSALDAETESVLTNAIQKLRGSTTLILIAHRLASVRNSDVVYYIDQGKLLSKGTFDEVRKTVPDFNAQANLLGL
jgi:ATP-binding cassette, subfamily B, bacterial PglK